MESLTALWNLLLGIVIGLLAGTLAGRGLLAWLGRKLGIKP